MDVVERPLIFSAFLLTFFQLEAAPMTCDYHVDDLCDLWTKCYGMPPIKMSRCPVNMVHSKSLKVCVRMRGPNDDCTSPKTGTIIPYECTQDKVDTNTCIFMKCAHGFYQPMPGCASGYRHKKNRNFACVHTSHPEVCVPQNGGLDTSQIITAKNPCDSNPCKNGGNCLLSLPPLRNYMCACVNGYSGQDCEEAPGIFSVCSSFPCLNGGTCSTTPSGYNCACPKNVNGFSYSGPRCEIKTQSIVQDQCFNQPCMNGGLCQPTNNGRFVCICKPGYTGQFCQTGLINLQACTATTCLNGGTCTVTSSGYNCACPATADPTIVYTGKNCEKMLAIDSFSCSSGPCLNGGTCMNSGSPPGYLCQCVTDPNGKSYAGIRCEEEITSSAIIDVCRGSSKAKMADSEECQRYYNCSLLYNPVPLHFKQYLDECPYPLVFDDVTKRCNNFTSVDCGSRRVLLDGCEYSRNKRTPGHSEPCINVYPSCKNKTDGQYEHPNKQKSPYYITCIQQRMMGVSMCSVDKFQIIMLFYEGKCTSRFQIPKSEGGFM